MSPVQPNYEDYLKNTLHIEDVNKIPKEQEPFCNIMRRAFKDCDDFQFHYIPSSGTEGIYIYFFKGIADIEKLEQVLLLKILSNYRTWKGEWREISRIPIT